MSVEDHAMLTRLAETDVPAARSMERLLYNQARSDRLFAQRFTLFDEHDLEAVRGERDARGQHGPGGGRAKRRQPDAS